MVKKIQIFAPSFFIRNEKHQIEFISFKQQGLTMSNFFKAGKMQIENRYCKRLGTLVKKYS